MQQLVRGFFTSVRRVKLKALFSYYAGRSCVYRDRRGERMQAPVQPHTRIRNMADGVDLNNPRDAYLTYRTSAGVLPQTHRPLLQLPSESRRTRRPHPYLSSHREENPTRGRRRRNHRSPSEEPDEEGGEENEEDEPTREGPRDSTHDSA